MGSTVRGEFLAGQAKGTKEAIRPRPLAIPVAR